MRIISGNFKGKKILEPKNLVTRPLKDLTKESIFNIILHSNKFKVTIDGSNVLDLFSGVGSFGLECLSRGSSHLTFIENYEKVLPILKRNIFNIKSENSSTILEKDIINNLNFKTLKIKFDIIFMDPPYKEDNFSILLDRVIKADILKKKGIIVIHRHKKDKIGHLKNFKIIEEKIYGISKVTFGTYF